MSQLGRPTKNNKTFVADFVDSVGREYCFLEPSELKLYEDTTDSLPMNFRLPKRIPVESRLEPPNEKQTLTLAHPETKEMCAKGIVDEVWLTVRSNVGLIFLKEFSHFANSSVEGSNDKKKKTNKNLNRH